MTGENFTRFESAVNQEKKKRKEKNDKPPSDKERKQKTLERLEADKKYCLDQLEGLTDKQTVAFTLTPINPEVHVLTVRELRSRLEKMGGQIDPILGRGVSYIKVEAVDPPETFPEEFKQKQGQEEEKSFENAIEYGLRGLAGFNDEDEIVYTENGFVDGLVTTAGKLRTMLRTMQDPKSDLWQKIPGIPDIKPYPKFIDISTRSPQEYKKEQTGKIAEAKKYYLTLLKEYDDDQELWVTFRNSRAFNPYKTRVRELRQLFWNLDAQGLSDINHDGGLAIISDDPKFDIEKWKHANHFRNIVLLKTAITDVGALQNYKQALKANLDNQPADQTITYALTKVPGSRKATVGELLEMIEKMSFEDVEDLGTIILDQPMEEK